MNTKLLRSPIHARRRVASGLVVIFFILASIDRNILISPRHSRRPNVFALNPIDPSVLSRCEPFAAETPLFSSPPRLPLIHSLIRALSLSVIDPKFFSRSQEFQQPQFRPFSARFPKLGDPASSRGFSSVRERVKIIFILSAGERDPVRKRNRNLGRRASEGGGGTRTGMRMFARPRGRAP